MNHKKYIFTVSSVYYALFFMAGGGFMSYIGIYYSSINLTNAQIGFISSAGLVAGLIGQPLWGTIADHARNKTRLLNALNLVAAGLVWFIPLSGSSFWLILASMVAFSFFGNAVMPMADSITIQLAKREGITFSTIRFIGSVGFALMAAVAGKILDLEINYIFVMFFVLRFAGGLVSFLIPSVEGHPKETKERDSFLDLFRDPKLVVIYAYVFVLSATMGFFSSFHSIYSRSLGIEIGVIGLGVMIGSLSQFPFTFFFDHFYKRIGVIKILLFSGFVYATRWFLYAYFLNRGTILFFWALHGFTFIVMYLCLADYIALTVPKHLQTRGQMMNNIVLGGASAIVGGLAGGWFSDLFSLQAVFLACSICGFLAVAAFAAATRFMPVFADMRAKTKVLP